MTSGNPSRFTWVPSTQPQPPPVAQTQQVTQQIPETQGNPQNQEHIQGTQRSQRTQQKQNKYNKINKQQTTQPQIEEIGTSNITSSTLPSAMSQVDNRSERKHRNNKLNKNPAKRDARDNNINTTITTTPAATSDSTITTSTDNVANTLNTTTTSITNNNHPNNRNKNNRNHRSGERMNNKYPPRNSNSNIVQNNSEAIANVLRSNPPVPVISALSPFAPVFVPGSGGVLPPPTPTPTSTFAPTTELTPQTLPQDNQRFNHTRNNNASIGQAGPSKNNRKQNLRTRGPRVSPNDSTSEVPTSVATSSTGASIEVDGTPNTSVSEKINSSHTPSHPHQHTSRSRAQQPRGDRQQKHIGHAEHLEHLGHAGHAGHAGQAGQAGHAGHAGHAAHADHANNASRTNKYKYVSSNNALKRQSRGVQNADDMPATIGDHTMLASKIIVKLNQNMYECMVCYEIISRKSDVWWCSFCYALFHLKCVDEWSSKSNSGTKDVGWRCPGCQHVYNSTPECTCFCSKTKRPEFNPYFIPHSCGENCSKPRGLDCPHPCPLLCHPGTCPPCTIPGKTKQCFCNKETYRLKCGEIDKGKTCGKTCHKPLKCGKHTCQFDCHPGTCANCKVIEEQRCYCGASTQRKLCGTGVKDVSQGQERVYSCGGVCNRLLACGNHKCKSVCHMGPCAECDFLPKRVATCPCGSTRLTVQRNSCIDPIPTCTNICNKRLSCGNHTCPQTCHNGPCAPCEQPMVMRCRCGSTSAPRVCHEVHNAPPDSFLCNAVCKRMKTCGQHACGVRCCPSANDATDPNGNHICTVTCDRPLRCGAHTCQQLCHKGRCRKCTSVSFDELACACGRTVVYPPVLCGTPIPRCPYPCLRERPCGHVSSLPHECHPGECSPCVALVDRMCMGEHMVRRNVRCSQMEVSCGFPCNKKLQCGNHSCTRICHSGPCFEESSIKKKKKKKTKGKSKQEEEEKDEGEVAKKQGEEVSEFDRDEASEPLPTCGRMCLAKLSTCEHLCQSICHPGKSCRVTVCKQISKVRCACGRRTGEAVCNHNGDGILSGNEAKPLPCDDACEVEIRNRKLAEALGIVSVHGKSPQYSDLLLNLVRASPVFVKKLEQSFEELINSPPSNSKLNLPIMDRVKRQLVHELAKYYQLETQSIDKEPTRSVVVVKTRDSKIPAVILSEYTSALRPATSTTQTPAQRARSDRPCVLHIYNLQSYVKTNHIVAFLQTYAGQYRLQWVDDQNCLAIFFDELMGRTALSDLSGGMFSVKMYKDLENPQESILPSQVTLTSTASAQHKEKKLTAKAVQAEEETWRRNDNAFAALTNVDSDPSSSSNTTTTTTSTTPTNSTLATSSTAPPASWEDTWQDESEAPKPASVAEVHLATPDPNTLPSTQPQATTELTTTSQPTESTTTTEPTEPTQPPQQSTFSSFLSLFKM